MKYFTFAFAPRRTFAFRFCSTFTFRLRRVEQFLRTAACLVAGIGAAHHPGQLLDPLGLATASGRWSRSGGPGLLLDEEVRPARGRDLRQVRDAQHLVALPQRRQLLSDDGRDAPADAGVDLVEDERLRAGWSADPPPASSAPASPATARRPRRSAPAAGAPRRGWPTGRTRLRRCRAPTSGCSSSAVASRTSNRARSIARSASSRSRLPRQPLAAGLARLAESVPRLARYARRGLPSCCSSSTQAAAAAGQRAHARRPGRRAGR